ncbi:MAG TPA: hypothetical protein VN777_17215 [Terriglobales bacterium]|nr:hypothetical protein [Terriglobales bacterium]HZW95881.1 hypothetical protein [Candidatus Eremiobacteraceae bacterium]
MNSNSEEKLGPIRRYLRNGFLGHAVEDEYHFDSRGQIFTVERGSVLYRARVSQEFLDDHAPAEITNLLHQWDLASALRDAGGVMVLVTNSGIGPR